MVADVFIVGGAAMALAYDLRLLAEMIGVDSAAAAVQICAEFFPDEDISPRSATVLQELFG